MDVNLQSAGGGDIDHVLCPSADAIPHGDDLSGMMQGIRQVVKEHIAQTASEHDPPG